MADRIEQSTRPSDGEIIIINVPVRSIEPEFAEILTKDFWELI